MSAFAFAIDLIALLIALAAVFVGILMVSRYRRPLSPEARTARFSGIVCGLVGVLLTIKGVVLLVTGG